jgi:hypothetical protein
MRRFYKHTLCIIENFRLTNPHLHHGLLGFRLQPFRVWTISKGRWIIMLRYRVPATPFQTLLVTYASKIFAGFAAPFIVLIFLPRSENLKPLTRRIILWAVGLIQVVLLIGFAYAAWKTPGDTTTAAIGDWIVVAVVAAGAAVPLWMKKEKPVGDLVIKV